MWLKRCEASIFLSKSNDEIPKRTHYARQLPSTPLGTIVRIAGWVEDVRPLGTLLFLTIRDVTGVSQAIVSRKNTAPEVYDKAAGVPRQSFVEVEGQLKESKAQKIPAEVSVQAIHIHAEALHPLPIDPTGRLPSSIDLRLDSRTLDLRDPSVKSIFLIRHTALQRIRRSLTERGFIEVNTSKLTGQAAEGGATLFAFDYFGRRAYLAQSPQLYKEQLTLSLDRVFEIAAYYRAEKSHTRRHLNEFMSVDIEAALMNEEDAMKLCEEVVTEAFHGVTELNGAELETLGQSLNPPRLPFERLPYEKAIDDLAAEGIEIPNGSDLTDHALKLLGERHPGFYFLTRWPLELKPFYIAQDRSDPTLSRSFDLQYGPLELASGGMRISSRKELEGRLLKAGLNPADFSYHLRTFDWGMPPHSGWGFGFDRFAMVLTGRQNIREVVLQPRDRFRLEP